MEGLVESTEQPVENLCTACFTGSYPVPIPQPDLLGRQVTDLSDGLTDGADLDEGAVTP